MEDLLSGKLKICDFGLSQKMRSAKDTKEFGFGTPLYAAPEVHGPAATTTKIDVFSFAVM